MPLLLRRVGERPLPRLAHRIEELDLDALLGGAERHRQLRQQGAHRPRQRRRVVGVGRSHAAQASRGARSSCKNAAAVPELEVLLV